MKELKDLLKGKFQEKKPNEYTKAAIQAAWDKTADQRYWTGHVKKVEITRG